MSRSVEKSGAPRGTICLKFGTDFVTVVSDVPRVLEYVGEVYKMMVDSGTSSKSRILSVTKSDKGYRVEGTESLEYPSPTVEPLLSYLREEIRLEFIRARPDLLWMHAAAVERSGTALILSGKSGNGKSTLSTLLCARGWKLMSDDTVALRLGTQEVSGFPQIPQRRRDSGKVLEPEDVRGLLKETVPLRKPAYQIEPARIGALVFLRYEWNVTAEVTKLTPGDAALAILENTTNFHDHRSAAVREAVSLARSLPIFSMTYGIPADAASELELLI
jgi:hypothetical protein